MAREGTGFSAASRLGARRAAIRYLSGMALIVEKVVNAPFLENSYVVGDEESREAFLVDPGGDAEELARALERHGLRPIAIVNTHAHIDHVAGVAEAQQRFKVPFWLHAEERQWLEALPLQAQMFGLATPPIPAVDRWLSGAEELRLGQLLCRVIATPGHTPGGCCLYFPSERLLFTGDTLFQGSIGRTDLPGGSMEEEIDSIRRKLFPLGDEVVFHSGHGEVSTLGEERRSNPFVGDGAV
jgi:glyoxylase-like metal-dependent hydrolase (beta-lactamase superfamily II)